MKYFAVIDTNMLVSSMLKGTSIPGIIVDKVINGPIVPLGSPIRGLFRSG